VSGLPESEGTQTSELVLVDGVREIAVPFAGSEYVCPECEASIPTRKQIRMAKPTKYEGQLNDVMKCPFCNFIFSPRQVAHVLRQ